MTDGLSRARRLIVPEVIQTSAMDCGPAVLKCLLQGFGIPVNYGRLREACQTDVDGTSINVLEEVARQVGLEAEQVMLPVEHLLLPEADALPAIVVVNLPGGMTHFVLVWRRHGPLVQVMDPALGRRWMTCRELLSELFIHRQCVPAGAWREWAASEDMLQPLTRRFRQIGVAREGKELFETAAGVPGWQTLARLQAALGLVESLVASGGVGRGTAAGRVLRSLLVPHDGQSPPDDLIPESYWSVQSGPPAEDGQPQLWLRGAVLIRVQGRRAEGVGNGIGTQVVVGSGTGDETQFDGILTNSSTRRNADDTGVADKIQPDAKRLSPELAAALAEPDSRPMQILLGFLWSAGKVSLLALVLGLVLLAGCSVAEALLLRGILDLGRDLNLVEQRLAAIGCLVLFGTALLGLEWLVAAGVLRVGRQLELRLRVAFLEKIPRLQDRYFQSRPTSDMADRGHLLHQIRLVPQVAGLFLRATTALLITAGAIAWADPASGPIRPAGRSLCWRPARRSACRSCSCRCCKGWICECGPMPAPWRGSISTLCWV